MAAAFFAMVFGVSAVASIVQKSALLGAVAGAVGGHLLFMLSLRCRPLASPALRTSSLGFGPALFGLVRTPFAVSLLWFAGLGGTAFAADGGSWQAIPSTGVLLVAANLVYLCFAAYYATAPLLAAFAYCAAVGILFNESIAYGREILWLLAIVGGVLLVRSRRRFRGHA